MMIFFLHGVLCHWRSFIQSWVVELLEAILGLLNELHRGLVQLRGLGEVLVLFLAHLGGLRNGLVKVLDVLLQSSDAICKCCNGISCLSDLGQPELSCQWLP